MRKEVVSGVQLSILPETKFKTTQVMVRFRCPLSYEALNQRSLLAAVLSNSSERYPQLQDINQVLEEQYGAMYQVTSTRRGEDLLLSFHFNFVNDCFLQENSHILAAMFDFLEEVIFHPAAQQGAFDEALVEREKRNLLEYMQAAMEDKQDYAILRLQSLYFKDLAQAAPYYGTMQGVEAVTASELYQAYLSMLMNDAVEVIVLGEVDAEQIEYRVSKLPFTPRQVEEYNPFYEQEQDEDILEEVETQAVNQSKLTLCYRHPFYYGTPLYEAFLVFNGLFGGQAHSKLFMNVRERESLAYYASSHTDAYRGTLLVQAGIDRENKEFVLDLIDQQLYLMQKGDFSEDDLQKTKALLVNQYKASFDQARNIIERESRALRFSDQVCTDFANRIQEVTKEEVQAIAQQISLETIYCLEGEGNNG